MDPQVWIVIAIGFGSLFALWLIFYFIPVGLWFKALVSGVKISLLQLVFMRWRKVPPPIIVNSLIASTKAGLQLNRDALEAHYLAGGHIKSVVMALISADKANMSLDFKTATAIDLAGRDVLEAVQMSVNPKVIDTPPVTRAIIHSPSKRVFTKNPRILAAIIWGITMKKLKIPI